MKPTAKNIWGLLVLGVAILLAIALLEDWRGMIFPLWLFFPISALVMLARRFWRYLNGSAVATSPLEAPPEPRPPAHRLPLVSAIPLPPRLLPRLVTGTRRWHAGQLATVIVAGLIIERFLFAWYTYLDDNDATGGEVLLVSLLAFSIGIALLWLSRTWFGGRQSQKPG